MEKNQPLVSVVMPVYKARDFVEEAIRSVMAQTVTDWELLIIDDCSPDDSYDLANALAERDERIRLIRNERNMGVARTRNRGIELSRGKYIAFLDSDDIWYPTKLAAQIELLEQTGAALSYCSYRIVDAGGKPVKPDYLVPSRVSYEDLLKENVVLCSSIVVPAELAKKLRFNTDFYHEDYVFLLDILKEGHMAAGCTEIQAAWRYMEDTRSFDKRKAALNRWRIYRDYLKLPLPKSAWVFSCYAFAGVRKYFRKRRDA